MLTATGLVVVSGGTFLPWVRSGAVLRDSYESISVIRALGVLDGGPLALVLDAWTMLVPSVTVCAALYALGFRRAAATFSAMLAIISGTVGGAATVLETGASVRLGIDGIGPTTTLVGAVLTLTGVAGIFAGRRRSATADAGGEP